MSVCLTEEVHPERFPVVGVREQRGFPRRFEQKARSCEVVPSRIRAGPDAATPSRDEHREERRPKQC
jgi:hypothetical protein